MAAVIAGALGPASTAGRAAEHIVLQSTLGVGQAARQTALVPDGGVEERKGQPAHDGGVDADSDGGDGMAAHAEAALGGEGAGVVAHSSRALLALEAVLSRTVQRQGHMDGPLCVSVCDGFEASAFPRSHVEAMLAGRPRTAARMLRHAIDAVTNAESDRPVVCRLAALAFYRTLAKVLAKALLNSGGGGADDGSGSEDGGDAAGDQLHFPRCVATVLNDQVIKPGLQECSPVRPLFRLFLKCLKTPAAKREFTIPMLAEVLSSQAPLDDVSDDGDDEDDVEAPLLPALAALELHSGGSMLGFDPLLSTQPAYVNKYKAINRALVCVEALGRAAAAAVALCRVC